MKITDIVPEVLLEIVIHLDNYDLSNLLETNRFFYYFLSDEYIDRRLTNKKQVMDAYSKQLITYILDKNYFMIETLLKLGADPNKLVIFDDNLKKKAFKIFANSLSLDDKIDDVIADKIIKIQLLWLSPFVAACQMDDKIIIELMLKYGANVNQSFYFKFTDDGNFLYFNKNERELTELPLINDVIHKSRPNAFKLLIENGVNTSRISVNSLCCDLLMRIIFPFNEFPNDYENSCEILELIMKHNVILDFNTPLNSIPSEKVTLLDAIYKMVNAIAEDPLEPNDEKRVELLKRFYNYLRQTGAKHYRELYPPIRPVYRRYPYYQKY